MATRARNRVVVPSTPPIMEPEPEMEDDTDIYHHAGLDAWRESGDYAVLMDASFNEWAWTVYRLYTPDEITKGRSGQQGLWITRIVGPLDVNHVQATYGGGTFEFWGIFERVLRGKIRVDLAGPRKDFAALPPAPPAQSVAVVAPQATDPNLLRLLEGQARALEALTAVVTKGAPAPAAPGMSIKDAIELVELIRPAPSQGALGEIVSAFKEGIALRAEVEGQPERSTTEIILDKVGPLVERVATQFLTSRPPIVRRSGPPPPTGTAVEPAAPPVVTSELSRPPEPPAAAEPAVDPGDFRMRTAVEVLASGLAAGEDPEDTADTIDRILQPAEMFILRGMTDADLTATLRSQSGGAFPILHRPEAEPFIAAVMAALRAPEAVE